MVVLRVVAPRGVSAQLPAGFVGLSLEPFDINSSWLDPTDTSIATLFSDLGASRLRIGGTESGIFFQSDPAVPKPAWARIVVTDADFVRLAALTARTGWRVDLGIGLAHFDPANAAQEVAAAARRLGPALASVEIGNEPDLFASKGLRPPGYGETQYETEVSTYRAAIEKTAPGVPIAGPDTARSPAVTDWLDRYVTHQHARLAFVTQHSYATTHCRGAATSIAELLSNRIRSRSRSLFDALVAAAKPFGVAARLDETNSTSCGGQAGVSDRFASALWIIDDLLDAASRGVAGANVHGLLEACVGYTPVCADRATLQLRAQPVFYGLLLLHAVGSGRFLAVSTTGNPLIDAYAVRRGDGAVAIVVVNRDARARTFVIDEAGASSAQLSTLTAPSLASAGATFAGSRVGDDGSFVPKPVAVARAASGYRIDVRAGSAALLEIRA